MRHELCVGEKSMFGLGRREILNQFGLGFGGLALSQMLSSEISANDLSSDKTHFPAKAKIAAKNSDKSTTNFFIVWAIFFELVLANQFKNK